MLVLYVILISQFGLPGVRRRKCYSLMDCIFIGEVRIRFYTNKKQIKLDFSF